MKRETVAALQLSTRATLAATLSVIIARVLELTFPLYAMIAAVIVTDLSARRTRELAGPRIAGTIFGAGGGAAIAQFLPVNVWTFALGILGSMFVMQLMRLPEAAKLAGYVCGIVLLDHHQSAWFYAFDRLIETVLGIAVAVAVSVVPKLIPETNVTEGGS